MCVFAQTFVALMVMSTNLLFFIWAQGKINTSTMRPLMNFMTLFIGEVDKMEEEKQMKRSKKDKDESPQR